MRQKGSSRPHKTLQASVRCSPCSHRQGQCFFLFFPQSTPGVPPATESPEGTPKKCRFLKPLPDLPPARLSGPQGGGSMSCPLLNPQHA